MALLDSEGFGSSTVLSDYSTYMGMNTPGNSSSFGTGGPFGDNYVNVTGQGGSNNDTWMNFRLVPSTVNFFTGMRVNFNNNNGTSYKLIFLDANATQQFYLQFNAASGTVNAYRGTSTTSIGTSATRAMPANGWFYLEVGGTVNATTGSLQVRVNGAVVLNLTGINIQVGLASIARVQWWTTGFIPAASVTHYYFCDDSGAAPNNTFLGDVRVQTLAPVSNDAVLFTHNGLAQNYLNAAKIPPVPATDYNSDSTIGDQDTFNMGAPAAGLSTVYGVHVRALMAKSDAGNRQGAAVIKSGGTVVAGAGVGLGTSATLVHQVVSTDPATGVAWTNAGVAAAQIGYKVAL